jgi:hypothetical protein
MEIDEMIADARAEEETKKELKQNIGFERKNNTVTIDIEEYMFLRDRYDKYNKFMDVFSNGLMLDANKEALELDARDLITLFRIIYPAEYYFKLETLKLKGSDGK